MTRPALAALLMLGSGLAASGADARDVELQWLAPATFAKEAASLKIPVSQVPAPGPYGITLTAAEGVDHETLRLGIYCSAYKVNNPMSAILKMVAAEASAPATPVPPAMNIAVTSARSMSRCVEVKEYNYRCITRVTLAGAATLAKQGDQAERTVPLSVTVERDASVGGFCEYVARGVGLVSREAAQQLVAAALAGAAAPPPAGIVTPPVSTPP